MNTKKNGLGQLWIFLLLTLLVGACKKKETGTPNEKLQENKSTLIIDLAGDTQASVGSNAPGKENRDFYTFLFRFKDQKQIWIKTKEDSAKWLKTNNWDLAFSGPYNSTVYVNNKDQEGNPGEGGASTAKVIMIEKTYETVDQAPSDDEFDKSEVSQIGWAGAGDSPGWYNYDIETHITKAIPNRTYVIRLTDGKYAKLQLINVYKGNPPTVTDLNWPAPYLTFRYFIQEDGSRNLSTKSN